MEFQDFPKMALTLADLGTLAFTADRNGTQGAFVSVAMQWAGEAQKEIERLRAEVKDLELAEEGAKTAFAHVVDQKHEIEAECRKLRSLLDAAYADIRRKALTPNVGIEPPRSGRLE